MVDAVKCCRQVEKCQHRYVSRIQCRQYIRQNLKNGGLRRMVRSVRRLKIGKQIIVLKVLQKLLSVLYIPVNYSSPRNGSLFGICKYCFCCLTFCLGVGPLFIPGMRSSCPALDKAMEQNTIALRHCNNRQPLNIIDGQTYAWPCSVFTQRQVFGPRILPNLNRSG